MEPRLCEDDEELRHHSRFAVCRLHWRSQLVRACSKDSCLCRRGCEIRPFAARRRVRGVARCPNEARDVICLRPIHRDRRSSKPGSRRHHHRGRSPFCSEDLAEPARAEVCGMAVRRCRWLLRQGIRKCLIDLDRFHGLRFCDAKFGTISEGKTEEGRIKKENEHGYVRGATCLRSCRKGLSTKKKRRVAAA